jgi:hypothetical protein
MMRPWWRTDDTIAIARMEKTVLVRKLDCALKRRPAAALQKILARFSQ